MNKKLGVVTWILIAVALTSCSSAINPKRVDIKINPIKKVCIVENKEVKVVDFLSVLKDGFDKRGISVEIISDFENSTCEYAVTYIAKQSWDAALYLSHAEIMVHKSDTIVGVGVFHIAGGAWSFNFANKWKSTKAKIDPVMDELLLEFSKY